MTDKTLNYTPEQTQQAVAAYAAGHSPEAIATTIGKSVRSVVAKLVKEGVYVSKIKTSVTTRTTKAMLIALIASRHDINAAVLATLEKANYEALEALAAI